MCACLSVPLPESNTRAIARSIEMRCYRNHDVVFAQNDPPDAYYMVLHGAVSIYALQTNATHSEEELRSNKRLKYGKFLVQLKRGAGFGELSFDKDYNHAPRNAGVVSDGSSATASVTFNDEGNPNSSSSEKQSRTEREKGLGGVNYGLSNVCGEFHECARAYGAALSRLDS